ncbi:MAG: hypothetical protein ABIE84_02550 [bacterium]
MPSIAKYTEKVDFLDKTFVGTITFRSEEFALPDGSKMALGIDGSHWVLVIQKSHKADFHVYKFDQKENKISVDEKAGGTADIEKFKKHIRYFFEQAKVDELVTLLPPQ